MTKKVNNHGLLLITLVAAALLAGGCKKKEQPPAPPPPQPKAGVKVQPPVQKQQSSAKAGDNLAAELDFTNRKDPFKAFVPPQAAGTKPAEATRRANLLPIQSYDVSKFKIAGIIIGIKENRALIIDPAGKGYVVKQGMPLGNNDGEISRITSTSLEVVESFRDDNGHLRKRTIKLTLPQKK
jgi:type IV pilus assembly protein PilP